MNNAVSKLKEYMQKFRQYETIENLRNASQSV